MRLTWVAAVALLLALPAGGMIRAGEPTPVGVWMDVSRRIQVEISHCGDAFCGQIVWFRWPDDADGLPLVDLKNPDPVLRTRPLLGLRVLGALQPRGTGKWAGGQIYNPDDGLTYHARLSISDDASLRVRAYLLLPLLGKTFVWTRVR